MPILFSMFLLQYVQTHGLSGNTHSVLLSLEYGKRAQINALRLASRWKNALALDWKVAAGVHSFSQVLTWFEMRNIFAGERYGLTCFRISANSGRPIMQRKAAKAPYFNAFTPGERIAHQIQQVFDCKLNVFRRQVFLLSGDQFNEF